MPPPRSVPKRPSRSRPKIPPFAAGNEASSGEFALQAKGYIITAHQILVSPKVNGMIVKLNIIESQRVKKDDILAELEDTFYRAERDRTKASLLQAKARLSRCKADHARAETLLPTKAMSQVRFRSFARPTAMRRRRPRNWPRPNWTKPSGNSATASSAHRFPEPSSRKTPRKEAWSIRLPCRGSSVSAKWPTFPISKSI